MNKKLNIATSFGTVKSAKPLDLSHQSWTAPVFPSQHASFQSPPMKTILLRYCLYFLIQLTPLSAPNVWHICTFKATLRSLFLLILARSSFQTLSKIIPTLFLPCGFTPLYRSLQRAPMSLDLFPFHLGSSTLSIFFSLHHIRQFSTPAP